MLNLGSHSATEFSGVRIHPTVVDRILEGVAALLVVASWACAVWVYLHVEDKATANSSFLYAGLGTLGLLFMGASAYFPIRLVRFPVRITERNVATQFFLVTRMVRVLNIIIVLLFSILVFSRVEVECGIPQGLCSKLIIGISCLVMLVLVVYNILAFKYK